MILDCSAVIAVIEGEAEAADLTRRLIDDDSPVIAAPTLVEASLVLQARWADRGITDLLAFLSEFSVRVVPFTEEHWRHAAGPSPGSARGGTRLR